MLLTKLAKNVAVRSSRARQSGRPSNMMLLRQGLSSSRLSTGLSRKPKKTLFSTTIHGQNTTKRDLVTRYQMSPKGGHASRLKWLASTCPSFMLANNLFRKLNLLNCSKVGRVSMSSGSRNSLTSIQLLVPISASPLLEYSLLVLQVRKSLDAFQAKRKTYLSPVAKSSCGIEMYTCANWG